MNCAELGIALGAGAIAAGGVAGRVAGLDGLMPSAEAAPITRPRTARHLQRFTNVRFIAKNGGPGGKAAENGARRNEQ